MNTQQKIKTDRLVGKPVVILLNGLARLLGFFFHRNHSLKTSPEIIYVSKYVGMGSIIQATPLLQSLRASFPLAQIIFITNRSNESLVRKFPFVDRCYAVDDSGTLKLILSLFILLKKIITLRPSVFIDLEVYSNFSTIVSTLSCATNRIGYYRKDSSIRLGIYTHMLFLNINHPISQSYLQMARMMDATKITDSLYDFNLSSSENKIQSKLVSQSKIKNLPAEYIVVNPNASDLRIERRWYSENFIRLLKLILKDEKKYCFVFIGSSSEKSYVESLTERLTDDEKKNIINTAGTLSLEELFQLINSASLMITNDTGPMHMAFALNTAVFALFGPCHPGQYGNQNNAHCFYQKVYCSPCVHEFITPPCKGDNQCMKKITVEEVYAAFYNWARDKKISAISRTENIIYSNEENSPLGMVIR